VRAQGPFASDAEALQALQTALVKARAEAHEPLPEELSAWFDFAAAITHRALALS
jgi:hypothetical protein